MPKVGIAACPTPAEELVVPVQVNRDNVHANVHLDLNPEYDIEDDWEPDSEYMNVDDVETSSSGMQNHPDYIPLETGLQAH